MNNNKSDSFKALANLFIIISILLFIVLFILLVISRPFKMVAIFAFLFFVVGILFYIVYSVRSKETAESCSDHTEVTPDKSVHIITPDEMRQHFDDALNEIPLVDIALSKNAITRRRLSDMPEIKTSNVTRATNPEKIFPLVVLDTEATGFQPSSHAIVELSAIKFEYPFAPVAAFSTLINPERRIPADASDVNGITNAMVKDSPVFSEIAPAFSDFMRGCNICGHNLFFDLRFLFASGLELPSGVKYFDTLDLARKTLVKEGSKDYNHHTGQYEENEDWDVTDHKLETLCEYYGIHRGTQHRALSDSYATAQVFKHLLSDKADLTFPEK